MSEKYKNPVKKIIPSRLETGFQKFLYKHLGKYIPKSMTPNQVTLVGAMGGLFAVISTLLTHISPLFFIGTLSGLAVHLVADDLDGYVARTRNMSSKAGAYFDLITDVIFSTFLIIAFGLSPYANIEIMAFAAPVYGIVNVT
ncbi:MAG: CDP-alcohol phosphatidyltransferase family protein, partial [Oscillospiraceae bacterium]|nr:CDP-alcohol phosphatidyltransferase family protein [Oscillospiraceae bacterium]